MSGRSYVTNFQHYVAPFPNWHVLVPNIRYFQAHGVLGIFEEGTYATSGGDLVELKDYLMARALWDPTVDADALTLGFLNGYYDAAARHVARYMQAMVGAINTSAYYMHESFDVDAPFLTPAALLDGAAALAAARVAVSDRDARFARRVEAAGMPVMYVILFRWAEVRAAAAEAGVAWPYNASQRAQFGEFRRRYEMLGITRLDEGGHDVAWMEAQLFSSAVEGSDRGRAPRAVVGSLHWPRPVGGGGGQAVESA
jgi:hypothetical protein